MAYINPPGVPIERGKVHEFANAILDDNPLYHDEEAAKRAGLPSVVAPPTFTSVAAFFPEKGAEGGPRMEGLDLRFVLHGGQEFNFERPLFAGDLLHAEPGETRQYEKQGRRGGTMKFVETETVYRDQKGDVVLRIKNTLIQTGGVVQP
ncbi:MAG TPA: MaoC family dehydratase N-terminal domain-containing protein [Dehalococcoidia bacterium]|nr:MaoC family dehydratase N-terminal domain-containing protein [Dehalococcoidia bacterium]